MAQVASIKLDIRSFPKEVGRNDPCEQVLTKRQDLDDVLEWLHSLDWSQAGQDMAVIGLPQPDGAVLIGRQGRPQVRVRFLLERERGQRQGQSPPERREHGKAACGRPACLHVVQPGDRTTIEPRERLLAPLWTASFSLGRRYSVAGSPPSGPADGKAATQEFSIGPGNGKARATRQALGGGLLAEAEMETRRSPRARPG